MEKGGGAGGIGENKLIVPQINQSVVIPAPANIVLTIFFYQKRKGKTQGLENEIELIYLG